MDDAQGGKTGNGTAVGVATVTAGLVGTIATSLFSGKKSRTKRAQEQVEYRLQVLEDSSSRAMAQLGKAVEGFNIQVPGDSKRAQRKARDMSKEAKRFAEHTAAATRRQVAELDREALRLQSVERAHQLGHEGSRRVRELAHLLNERTVEVIADNRTQLPEWRMRASRSGSEMVGKGSALIHQAIASAPEVRGNLSASTSGAISKSSEAAHQVLDQAPDVIDKVTKSIGSAAQHGAKLAGNVRDDAPGTVDKVAKSAHDVFDQARERVPDVRVNAHDIAVDASHRAHLLADGAKVHAPDVGAQLVTALHSVQETAKPVLHDVSVLATRLVDEAREAGSHASESLIPDVQHRADVVAGRAKTHGQASAATLSALGATAGHKISHTSEAVEQQSKAVATAAGRGTKDGASFVMWSLAAAGIVYYAFLNEEQRVKAKESGQRIATEIKEVYRDIRGYDEEFT
ncbi:MAG: hypothetical protein WKF63_06230 [Thermomicrobiales bacterium]